MRSKCRVAMRKTPPTLFFPRRVGSLFLDVSIHHSSHEKILKFPFFLLKHKKIYLNMLNMSNNLQDPLTFVAVSNSN